MATIKQGRQVPKVSVNEPKPISGRIAWHMENSLVRFIKRVFNVISNPLRSLIAFAIEEAIEIIEAQAKAMLTPVLRMYTDNPAMPPEIRNALNKSLSGEQSADLLLWVAGFIALITSLGGAATDPAGRLVTYSVETKVRSHRPDPVSTILMEKRRAFDADEKNRTLNEIGIGNRYKTGYERLSERWLEDFQLGQAHLRGKMSEQELRGLLADRNMPGTHIDHFIELLQVIPGPSDLIRMAVREAWDDNVARKFGYDNDFPAEFAETAEKIGLSSEWSKRFWRAHWELPGVREGFDMLHRRIIDEDELKLLLRVRDIPSFWRDRLVKLSFDPYTRVDVRRMYTAGVLTENEVFETYLDLGYDEEHASNLMLWTIQEFGQEGRDLTKSDVIGAYTDNTITADEATNMLDALDYDPFEIAILLARADLKKQQRFEKEFVENVRVAFVGKQINDADVIGKLNTLNPPSGFVEERLLIWRLQRERAVTRPTKADIQKFWLAGIINDNQVIAEMSKRNYTKEYTEWYMSLWKMAQE